jgi:hypothetical protein
MEMNKGVRCSQCEDWALANLKGVPLCVNCLLWKLSFLIDTGQIDYLEPLYSSMSKTDEEP